ncbi:hypothetical protein BKK81_05395 [Cupriavidus sp. USMAHM13]|nr:hypothetical protein BKK81_05395 [Cupriavidus sp. USMAHM13]
MQARGLKVPKAVKTVAGMFEIIEADTCKNAPHVAERFATTYGEGIHAITFYSANEARYRGSKLNLQWRSKGKKCEPINGSADVSGTIAGKTIRGGLRALLIKYRSITAGEWYAVKEAAQEAASRAGAVEEKQIAADALADLGLFEAERPLRSEVR